MGTQYLEQIDKLIEERSNRLNNTKSHMEAYINLIFNKLLPHVKAVNEKLENEDYGDSFKIFKTNVEEYNFKQFKPIAQVGVRYYPSGHSQGANVTAKRHSSELLFHKKIEQPNTTISEYSSTERKADREIEHGTLTEQVIEEEFYRFVVNILSNS